MIDQRWPIGTKFTPIGKHQRERTVVDVLRTYNNAGEQVRLTYVTSHQFMEQEMLDQVCDATIARGSPRKPE